jgi:hypothetical protein
MPNRLIAQFAANTVPTKPAAASSPTTRLVESTSRRVTGASSPTSGVAGLEEARDRSRRARDDDDRPDLEEHVDDPTQRRQRVADLRRRR